MTEDNIKMVKCKCSYCGEEMECPESMLDAGEHICSFCLDVMEEGMSKEEIKEASKRERELSKYYKDVGEMANTIFSFVYKETPKKALKKMNKKRIEEDAFYAGIVSALDFILHTAGPEALISIRDSPGFRFFYVPDEEIEKAIEDLKEKGIDIDPERMETFNGKLETAEDIAKMINYVMFKGDWKKQLEWEEKRGHKEDIELVKKIMADLGEL